MHIKMKGDGVSASAPRSEFMFSLKTKAGADSIVQLLQINTWALVESAEEVRRGKTDRQRTGLHDLNGLYMCASQVPAKEGCWSF